MQQTAMEQNHLAPMQAKAERQKKQQSEIYFSHQLS